MNPSHRALLRFIQLPGLMAICGRTRSSRCFSVTSSNFLKEIVRETSKDGNTIVVSGKYIKSPRENNIIQLSPNAEADAHLPVPADAELTPAISSPKEKKSCVLCQLKAQGLAVKHTDVLIINQFLDTLGNQLTKDVTGLCLKEHKRMGYIITMAKYAGLIKGPLDPEPTQRQGYMKYNKYYDESVIDEFFTTRRKKH